LFLYACSSTRKTSRSDNEEAIVVVTPSNANSNSNNGNGNNNNNIDNNNNSYEIDSIKILKEKYARYLHIPPDSIANIKLYVFIDKWLKTSYLWGGTTEDGIDCSAFIQRLLKEVYNLKIPRTSIQQLYTERVELFSSPKYLSEGDILFFRTMDNKIVSHVGIYLHNYMFVNSSSSKGVSIASLKELYWRQRFVVAGRIKVTEAQKPL